LDEVYSCCASEQMVRSCKAEEAQEEEKK
jgi:hypothetical protein